MRSCRPQAGLRTSIVAITGLLLVAAGCGSDDQDTHTAPAPSKAAKACRGEWKDLNSKVEDRDTATTPSTLPQRWNTIAATIDYYVSSGTAKDCGKTLTDQQKAIDALAAFNTRVAPYDMELALSKVQKQAETYATSTPTPSPTPTTKKGKQKQKQKRQPAPPSPALVGRALAVLTTQAPVASQQQGPAWEQASVIELSDPAAVAKALKDLAFLSSESAGYRTSKVALAAIDQALHPVTTR